MNRNEYRKVEFFLYNFSNTDELIKEIEGKIIDNINVSGNTWKRGITVCNNTLENQVVKLVNNRKIRILKEWRVLNKMVLAFFYKNFPVYYQFLKMKYLEKKTKEEIQEKLKIDFKQQKRIKYKLLGFIIKKAKKRNMV